MRSKSPSCRCIPSQVCFDKMSSSSHGLACHTKVKDQTSISHLCRTLSSVPLSKLFKRSMLLNSFLAAGILQLFCMLRHIKQHTNENLVCKVLFDFAIKRNSFLRMSNSFRSKKHLFISGTHQSKTVYCSLCTVPWWQLCHAGWGDGVITVT